MSEIEVEAVEEVEAEEVEETKEDLTPEQNYEAKQAEQASKDGWKPYDDWVEGGGDPEKWVPAGS